MRRVEQSEEMERSVTQVEWRERGELMGQPVRVSQTCNTRDVIYWRGESGER